MPRESQELLERKLLIPEEDDHMLEEGFTDLGDGVLGDIGGEIHTLDLGADRTGKRNDLDGAVRQGASVQSRGKGGGTAARIRYGKLSFVQYRQGLRLDLTQRYHRWCGDLGPRAVNRNGRNADCDCMKLLIALTVAAVLALAGVMFTHERGGPSTSAAGSHQRIQTISTGRTVDLAPHLRDGTWTVVEFTAEW